MLCGPSLASIREATGELPALSRNASTLATELQRDRGRGKRACRGS